MGSPQRTVSHLLKHAPRQVKHTHRCITATPIAATLTGRLSCTITATSEPDQLCFYSA